MSKSDRTMTQPEIIRELEELLVSPGWYVVRTTLQAELDQLMARVVSDPTIDQRTLDYQRGAMAAAQHLLNAPANILNQAKHGLDTTPKTEE